MVATNNILIKVTAPRTVPVTVMLNAYILIHTLKMVNLGHAVLKWISGKQTKSLHKLLHTLVQVKEISSAQVITVAPLIDTMVFVKRMVVDTRHIHLVNICSIVLDPSSILIPRRS